jgi:hypothetical protein
MTLDFSHPAPLAAPRLNVSPLTRLPAPGLLGETRQTKGTPFFKGVASCEEKWGGCAFCNMADKGLTMTERRKPLKLRVKRQIMRRISQESWTDQLVLRQIRPNRRKANRQHQRVRRRRLAIYHGKAAPWDEDNEVNPKIDLKKFLKK